MNNIKVTGTTIGEFLPSVRDNLSIFQGSPIARERAASRVRKFLVNTFNLSINHR